MKEYFFQAGGTLDEDAPSYIERDADTTLLNYLERGEVCLVLAPRQVGKSSLMVRTIAKLRKSGVNAGIVDLQSLGISCEQEFWFSDVVFQIGRSLCLRTDATEWWEKNRRLGPAQRFMVFVEDVVLAETQGKVVIFFDEIDSVLPLPFSDDFFTTIRAVFNARAGNPVLKRITFVLLGVAVSSEFVKNRLRTPFNIGKEIDLSDLGEDSLIVFRKVLGTGSDPLLDRIFYWTGGQPMMVQKLAELVYSLRRKKRVPKRVDEAVKRTYFDTRIEKDTHLKFIRDYLLEDNKKVRKTLKTYRSVLENKEIPYDEQSPVHSRLKLAGVVRAENGKLFIRNRVYQKVFDRKWIKENTPRDIVKIVAYTASSVLVAVLLWFFLVQPVFFPKFTSYQNFSWFDRDVYYTDRSSINLDIPIPSEKEIVRITVNGEDISLPEKTDIKKAGISFNNFKIGENHYQIRFYSGLWKENFEKKLSIVSYPKKYWKILETDFVFLPSDIFMMGDETQHQVTLTRGFYMQSTEVTQGQWKSVMETTRLILKVAEKIALWKMFLGMMYRNLSEGLTNWKASTGIGCLPRRNGSMQPEAAEKQKNTQVFRMITVFITMLIFVIRTVNIIGKIKSRMAINTQHLLELTNLMV
ncbi:MAG: hypothetical protein GY795_08860 [Desulfobacterales bacterium]|nr:hypothetical protein [Desulfobacterales bacterium]